MIARCLLVMSGGFLASAHCIGMCGGFACAVASTGRGFWPVLARQGVYNAGRIFTYAFLGALAGATGFRLSQVRIGPLNPQQIFSMLAGVVMLALGLLALGVVRLPRGWGNTTALFAPLFSHFLGSRGWWGYFVAGLANGFLPCGLVYAFLAVAAASGDAFEGLVVMTFFGVGTLPAMLLAAGGGRVLGVATRHHLVRAAAAMVVLMGGVTIWRAWPRESPGCCHPAEASHEPSRG